MSSGFQTDSVRNERKPPGHQSWLGADQREGEITHAAGSFAERRPSGILVAEVLSYRRKSADDLSLGRRGEGTGLNFADDARSLLRTGAGSFPRRMVPPAAFVYPTRSASCRKSHRRKCGALR